MLSFKPAFSLSSLTFIKRLFSSTLFSAIRVILMYLELLFPPAILIPVCDSSSPGFHLMCFAQKLNKQGDNIQLCPTPFAILNLSIVPCLVVTVASWPAYRLLRRQERWSGIPNSKKIPHSVVIHTVKGFIIVNEAEVNIFLEFSYFYVIQWMLQIWSLVPLPFLSTAWRVYKYWKSLYI